MSRTHTYRRIRGLLTGEAPSYIVFHDDHAIGQVRRSVTNPRLWVTRPGRVDDWQSRHRDAAWEGFYATRADAAAALWDSRCDVAPAWLGPPTPIRF